MFLFWPCVADSLHFFTWYFNLCVSILTLCRRFTIFFKNFNWSLGYFSQKVNNFSYNKGFWIWLGESHDFFQSHGGFLMIFLISSNHTVKGTFEVRPTCTWVLEVYIYLCGYFVDSLILCVHICIYIWVETLKGTGLQLMTRSWMVC